MNNEEHQMPKEACQKTDRNSVAENTFINAMYSVPNGTTIAAIKEAHTATNKTSFDNVESLLEELGKSNLSKRPIL